MHKFKRSYLYLFTIFLILVISIPSFSQESPTPEEPTPPTETPLIVTEEVAPSEAAPTEEITPTEEIVAPTEEILPTEEVALPTEELIVPSEEAVVTETPVAELTPETVIPTAAPQETVTEAPSGDAVEMLVQYNPSASEASLQEMLRLLGAVELERIPQLAVMRVLIPSSVATTQSALSSLQSSNSLAAAGLVSMEPNIEWRLDYTPNDTLFLAGEQPNLEDDTTPPDDDDTYSIFMETTWQQSLRDGLGVTVAVIDSGVDLQHPEFLGKLVPGWDFYWDDASPDDDNGHGTHVAGVIAAKTNNGMGIASVAYNAMVMPVKVCSPSGGCPTYEIAAGIIFATDRGAKVINLSLGGSQISTTVQGAVQYALSRNVVVVAAAGNNGDANQDFINDGTAISEINYPASYDGVISVASLDLDNGISYFSATSPKITVAAPGDFILSTWPIAYPAPFSTTPFPNSGAAPTGYEIIGGTSMASPHVAAVAALLIADGVATTPATVREAITCSARDEGDVGYDNAYGYGLIQPYYALTWNGNSGNCQVSLPNDRIENAMLINSPTFSVIQAISDRSVTESSSDPEIGGETAYQTLWYKFTPVTSGQYLFSTIGSGNLSTLIGVYAGQPGALRELANGNNSGSVHGLLAVSLTAAQTYYIQVGVEGSEAIAEFIHLSVNPSLTLATIQQETATFIRYTGTWNRVAVTGSSGGFLNTTTDANATASFVARGTSLKYTRMVGPAQGNALVYIDGVSQIVDNYRAITRSETITLQLPGGIGQWHLITITSPDDVLPTSIDAIQVLDGSLPTAIVGAVRLNETTTAFTNAFQAGAWFTSTGNTGPLLGDLKYTSTPNAFVEFRATGSAITFYRRTGTGTGLMDVYVDNVLVADDVDNTSFSDNLSAPFSIANLSPRERVVRIVNVSGSFYFDGAHSPLQAILPVNVNADDRSLALAYTGNWAKVAVPATAANLGTLSNIGSLSGGGTVAFMFSGNHLCIGYQQGAGDRFVNVIIDGTIVDTIDTTGALNKIEWCTFNNGINQLTDGLHSVILEVEASNSFNFDYVRPIRRPVFTSTMGYITETNLGFFYDNAYGVWTTTSQRSLGGSMFQGGSARRASISPTLGLGPRLSFTMNGTGFILYTSLPGDDGFATGNDATAWEIRVDDVVLNISLGGVTDPYLSLYGDWDHFRPIGIGVVNVPLGIHKIELRGINPDGVINPRIDFDGIRVLP
jgi:subtilisin family serine protease